MILVSPFLLRIFHDAVILWSAAECLVPPSACLLSSRWVLPALPAGLWMPPSPAIFCWIGFFLAQLRSFSCSGVPCEAPCLRNSFISLQDSKIASNLLQGLPGWSKQSSPVLWLHTLQWPSISSGHFALITCGKKVTGTWGSWFLQSLKLPLAGFHPQQRKEGKPGWAVPADLAMVALLRREGSFSSRCKLAPHSLLGLRCCLPVELKSYVSPVSLQRSAVLLPLCARASSLGNEMAKRYKKFMWTLEASLCFGVPLLSLFYALLVFMEIFSLWRNWKVCSVLSLKFVFPGLSHFQAKA